MEASLWFPGIEVLASDPSDVLALTVGNAGDVLGAKTAFYLPKPERLRIAAPSPAATLEFTATRMGRNAHHQEFRVNPGPRPALSLDYALDTINNSGTISGGVLILGGPVVASAHITNAGVISGGIDISDGGSDNTIVNRGLIQGGMVLFSGREQITNFGTISGDIVFALSAVDDDIFADFKKIGIKIKNGSVKWGDRSRPRR